MIIWRDWEFMNLTVRTNEANWLKAFISAMRMAGPQAIFLHRVKEIAREN
jgi:hypothetical protein